MFDSTTRLASTQCPQYSYTLEKSHWAVSRVCKFWGFPLSEFRLNNNKWDEKSEWIFSTKEFLILVSSSQTQCFRIRPCLQKYFPCSWQNINRYHSAWCTTYQDFTFYVSILIVSGKREGEEREGEPPLLCTIIFFSK